VHKEAVNPSENILELAHQDTLAVKTSAFDAKVMTVMTTECKFTEVCFIFSNTGVAK